MPRFFAAQKDDFIGKAATLAQAPRPFKIVYLEVDAADTDARGGEPVLAADGRCIGVTTSGAYGHRVNKSLAFACVDPAFEAAGSTFDILLQRERRRATVLPAPAFDADNSRMRV
jgi:dimethylglycine dehydrogenase